MLERLLIIELSFSKITVPSDEIPIVLINNIKCTLINHYLIDVAMRVSLRS